MEKAATSTGEYSRFTHLCKRAVLLSILVSFPSTLPVIAQEGVAGFTTTSPIPTPDPNPTISAAVDTAETAESVVPADGVLPKGAVEPKLIAKTFLATAYCIKGQTATGIPARRGIIAADTKVLPLGSVVRIEAGPYSGVYTVMDTGGAIRGQRIDLFLPTRAEAVRFGSRRIKVEILRRGWDPDPEIAEVK